MNKALPFLAVILLSSCAGYHLRKADQAYALLAYEKADAQYEKALPHLHDRDALLRAADSRRQRNDLTHAEVYYHSADSMASLTGDHALHYGEVLMGLNQPKAAAPFFLRTLSERPEDRAAMDLYASCSGYLSFYHDSSRFVVNELTLPGMRNVFSGVPYKKGLLVAGEQDAPVGKANPWNGMSFLDLYYSEKKTIVTWLDARPIPGKVNGPWHEGPAVTSADGRTLYFTRSNYYEHKLGKDQQNTSHLKLFRASLDEKGEWSDIREFAYNGETFSTGHPALSADGHTLYFASDRPGGFGGSDIWASTDNGTGWAAPVNLGASVNTPGNELFPTINGSSLYFASTAHENLGGLDIFETHHEGDFWSEPLNLNYPINTTHDDFSFVMDTTGKSGFLSSDRNGHDRIFSFIAVDPIFFVEGDVSGDSTSRFLPNTLITLRELNGGDSSMTTDADGHFKFKLKPNTDYVLKAQHPDMITLTRSISTKGLPNGSNLHVDFHLNTILLDQPIQVKNIYFDYDKWDIRPDAAAELNKLARLFIDNPQLSFELSSHTDSRGGDTYNLVLSDARANSTVNYLIQVGVDPERIAGMGYGENVLTNRCRNGVKCTEEEHQANRRTEFKVVNVKSLAKQ